LSDGDFTEDAPAMGPSPDADGAFYSVPADIRPRIIKRKMKQSSSYYDEDDEEEESILDDIGPHGNLHIYSTISVLIIPQIAQYLKI
jgi:hypothetical protein